MFNNKKTGVFDLLFWGNKDPVIIFENGKGIIKMNDMAKKFFLSHKIDELVKEMDKSSSIIWNNFLEDARVSNLANCQIRLSDSLGVKSMYHIEGYYNQSTFHYFICFQQVQEQEAMNNRNLDLMKYETIFKYAPYGFILTTVDGEIIEANLKVETFFDVSPGELIGESLNLIFDLLDDSKPDTTHFIKILLSKGSAEMISTKIDDKGEKKYYQFVSEFNKSVDMYITVIRDDTEKIQLRKQIDHHQSLSTLGQLAASIAHEIRNPMTSLKGFTQLLSDQVTKEGSQYLSIIESELNRMESILNEFLVLSKPAERSFRFISISSLISQVVDFMYPQGILQNVELKFVSWEKDSDCIRGDAYELKKMFMNIIKNAIEVMQSGGKIIITQTLFKNNQVRVSVKDQGDGLTPEQMHQIFLPFYTSKQQGTGLGLAHAVQTIENHGGYIEVESKVNEGTTFHLVFPIKQIDEMEDNSIHDQDCVEASRGVILSNSRK